MNGSGPPESDADYFRRRASEEEEAASRATDEHSAEIHHKLARRYTDLAARDEGGPQAPGGQPT